VPAAAVCLLFWLLWGDRNGNHGENLSFGAVTYALGTIGLCCLVLASLRDGLLSRALCFWPLRLIGAMCFSIYAWHLPLIHYVNPSRNTLSSVSYFGLLTLISMLSYKFIEFPHIPMSRLMLLQSRSRIRAATDSAHVDVEPRIKIADLG
jgi:peptidoglycan/LPS O-acetylase OafA/YrhL